MKYRIFKNFYDDITGRMLSHEKFSFGFSTNWKSFLSPTIVATLILIATLYFFGPQNSMIAPFVTISYLHFINMKNHYACMVRQLCLYLLIAVASYVAVINLRCASL